MVNAQLGRAGRLFLIPLLMLLLGAMACGTSATDAPEPASNETPAAAAPTSPPPATIPLVGSTATPLAPVLQATPSAGGVGLVNFDIKDPIIDPDRPRSPEGSFVLALHTALSPKWMDPR